MSSPQSERIGARRRASDHRPPRFLGRRSATSLGACGQLYQTKPSSSARTTGASSFSSGSSRAHSSGSSAGAVLYAARSGTAAASIVRLAARTRALAAPAYTSAQECRRKGQSRIRRRFPDRSAHPAADDGPGNPASNFDRGSPSSFRLSKEPADQIAHSAELLVALGMSRESGLIHDQVLHISLGRD